MNTLLTGQGNPARAAPLLAFGDAQFLPALEGDIENRRISVVLLLLVVVVHSATFRYTTIE